MKFLTNSLIYTGSFHIVSTLVLYLFVRKFSYAALQSQYSQGGIEAIFEITESNYHFGLVITIIFAAAAVFKGLELKHENHQLGLSRLITNGILALVVLFSTIYFTFLNLLILFNPEYF